MASKTFSSTDPPWQRLRISKSSLQDLKTQSSILHLLHHRSQNQHRRSIWYRHFNMFRKQLRTLVEELDPEVPADALPSRKVKAFNARSEMVEKRLTFWASIMVAKWYRAFSQLIGDKQFAVLGLTLLAILGKVIATLDLLSRMEQNIEVDVMQEALDRAVQAAPAEDARVLQPGIQEDLGETIARSIDDTDDIGTPVERVGVHGIHSDKVIMETNTKPVKKKRKRGGDAIDDLFSGLV